MKIKYKSNPERPIGRIIRELELDEIEVGLHICSSQNKDHVYMVFKDDENDLYVNSVYKISPDGEIDKLRTNLKYWIKHSKIKWIEAEASRFFNLQQKREDVLMELGI